MIKLFEADVINFNNNGIGILNNITKAYSDNVLNALFGADFEVTYDEREKWKEIINGRIIYADEQPFRIYKTVKKLRSLSVYTRHVFWDLLNNEVRDIRPTDKSGQGAMNDILGATNYPHPFTALCDIGTLNTQYYINKNPVECLIGTDSLITRWGGELKLDKWLISILGQIGTDSGVSIAYRKNMLSIDVEENYDSLITRMRPKGKDGLELPEVYVDSQYIDSYPSPIIREVSFDIGIDEENEITEAMAIEQLRSAANQYYIDTKCDIPLTNIKVNMALLENTEEYKSFQDLVRVNLGDTVTCKHLDLGINHKMKVIRIKKDLLTGKNAEVELGDFKQGLPSAFTKIENTFKDMSEVIANNKSSLQLAIDNATELLTTALGGYVVKRNGELLIMDTEDPATATKVWRWNINGLGYSDTGINGPYGLAMTMDGRIVANFITTGVLTSILIQSDNYVQGVSGMEINLNDGTIDARNFKLNSLGSVDISGNLTQRNANGNLAVEIKNSGLRVYDWQKVDDFVGGITSTVFMENGRGMTAFYGDIGNPIHLGHKLEDGKISRTISIDDSGTELGGLGIIVMMRDLALINNAILSFAGSDYTIPIGNIYNTDGTNNMVYTFNPNVGGSFFISSLDDNTGDFATAKAIIDGSGIYIFGDISCSGTKNRIVNTSYGEVALNAYETADCLFGDVGEGQIGEDGLCYIYLDPVFAETIDTTHKYQVFTQLYGRGELFVIERNENYFLIEGTPNLHFAWEIKAKQRDYTTNRLEIKEPHKAEDRNVTNLEAPTDFEYGDQGNHYYEEFIKEEFYFENNN